MSQAKLMSTYRDGNAAARSFGALANSGRPLNYAAPFVFVPQLFNVNTHNSSNVSPREGL